MRLIKEFNESINYLVEDSKDPKKPNVFIEGVFLQSDLKNKNGRIYPREIMQREVNRYVEESVNTKRAYGELGHPDGPTVNLDRVSHMIVSLKEDGNNWIGKAKVMDTPMGRIVKELISEGAQLGVSSRGLGSLKEKGGINEVQDDFMLATAADIVADPSAPDAFVQGIMEGKEWVFVNGRWTEQDIEESQGIITRASQGQLEEAKLEVFSNFMSKLSKY
jgi:hypothetical protein|tara:strand:+ start:1670 stop:2329 length:660 start_codon:yes stop_codon:yes gene_type:complete